MNSDTARDGKRVSRWAILAVLFPLLALACGPFFPNSLLGSGDDAVLQSPTASFVRELNRLRLEPPPRIPVPLVSGSDREVTVDGEILDLRRALRARGLATNEVAEMVLAFSRSRADLEDYRREVEAWEPSPRPWMKVEASPADDSQAATNRVRPALKFTEPPSGLPREFDLYLRAAAAWHDGRTNEARETWSKVLALPVSERSYKTTWATYMLGRSWHEADPARARDYYDRTRKLARAGFADTAGLAIASLGWEGQLRLRTNDLAGALRLYLDQYAAGASNAALSLRVTATRILNAPEEERLRIAQDPVFRRVVTSWVLSLSTWSSGWGDDAGAENAGSSLALRWLETVEASGASEVALAEQMSVLAYQTGQWAAARRWVELAPDSAVADWIRAKLLLREGKLEQAASELSRAVSRLPVEPPEPAPGEPPEFVDSLSGPHDEVPGRKQALGELGVLRVARGEFVQALDALLRADFRQDAAYVAERILTVEELQAYVDAHWSQPAGKRAVAAPGQGKEEAGETKKAVAVEAEADAGTESVVNVPDSRTWIRHLLARRLNRVRRGPEAIAYFPAPLKEVQTRFLERMRQGMDRSTPERERARAWFEAAWLARTNGVELLATEVAPDWAIWDCQYEQGPTHVERAGDKDAKLLRPTSAELRRAEQHTPEPDERFHFRYSAARLAWESAKLLPNNDPETAQVLWTAGRWLKARDPKFADLFYKALVRRCRKTELGDAADRQRWFPELDENGKPVVTRKQPPLPPAGGETRVGSGEAGVGGGE